MPRTARGLHRRAPRDLERRYRRRVRSYRRGRKNMQRREFLAGTLASSALAIGSDAAAQTQQQIVRPRQFYQLRRYTLQTGQQTTVTEKYISEALIPALANKGGPIGAFRLDIGP